MKEFFILCVLNTSLYRGVKSDRTIRKRALKNPQNVSDDYRYRKYTRTVNVATTAHTAGGGGGNTVKISIGGYVGVIVFDSAIWHRRVSRKRRTDGQTNCDRHVRQTTRANRERGSTSATAVHYRIFGARTARM